MKKLNKYIQKANFVKLYTGDADGQEDISLNETARRIDKVKKYFSQQICVVTLLTKSNINYLTVI